MLLPDTHRKNNRTSRTWFCCISHSHESSDDKIDTDLIFGTAQKDEAVLKPSIEMSVPLAEEVDIMEELNPDKEQKEHDVKIENDTDSDKICRYCLSAEGEFIAPCNCMGSQKWVHRECLMKWQRACQIRKSTHPWYREQTNPEKICSICVTKFDVDPPNYEDLVRGVTGNQVISQIREGFMIVATMESSERSEAILSANPDFEPLRNHLSPWVRGVYLIIDISPEMRGEVVTAVNLTKKLNRPPSYFQDFIRRFRHKKVQVKWMDAGPCEGLHGVGCLRCTSREQVEEETSLNVLHDMPCGLTVAGAFEIVVEMCHKDWYKEKKCLCQRNRVNMRCCAEPPLREVCACCGDGTWTRVQLIGEIARGSWGMAPFKTNDVFKVPNKPEPPAPDDIYMMLQDENRPAVPEETVMREVFDEALDPAPFQDTAEARQHREDLRTQLLARSVSPRVINSEPASPYDMADITIEADSVGTVMDETKEDGSLEPSSLDMTESRVPRGCACQIKT